jgi:hypothetical protein
MVEKVSIMEEHWDYLVILDACRYDFFSKLYRGYLRGNLEKRISLGSSTIEWCKKSFRERYDDVIYISANPFVNSNIAVMGFSAKDHFHRVIDVWNWGWNEELGTVHPKDVNRAMQNFKDDYPDKRFIIHYLQPHSPYLSHQLGMPGFPQPQISRGHVLTGIKNGRSLSLTEKALLKALVFLAKRTGFCDKNPSWKIRELLNLPPATPIDAVRRRIGKSGLRQAYTENLRLVLQYVARLVQDLSGAIIITADHGECLGEEGFYSHHVGLSDPLLLEVPWFEVKKVTETKKQCKDTERNRIKQRIKELKASNRDVIFARKSV